MLEKIKNEAIAYAEEVDSAKLLRAVESPALAWQYLELLANDKDFPATVIARTRTDVKTIKKNFTRQKDLNTWVNQEAKIESPYWDIYMQELALMNAYAIQAFIDIYKADSTIFNHIADLQKAKAEEEAKKKAEAKAKREAKNA